MNKKFLFLLFILFLSLNVLALTTTDTNYSGGVYNWDFELGTGTSTTTSGSGIYVGDSNYGWVLNRIAGTGTVLGKFDTVIKYSGSQSIFLSLNSSVDSRASISIDADSERLSQTASDGKLYIPISVKPLTKYKFSAYLKGQNCLENSCGMLFEGRTLNYVATTSGNSYLPIGDSNFIYREIILTTGATTYYFSPQFRINVAGQDQNMWIDDVRLEEVSTLNLSGQVSGRPSIVVSGVSDFNAIDQADTNNSTTEWFGDSSSYAIGQCFTPTQSKFTGIYFQRASDSNTFTGDVIVSLRKSENGTYPTATILATTTISNATWEAMPSYTDYRVALPYILDANGTNKYCVDFNATIQGDANNHPRLVRDATTGSGYSGGTEIFYNGTVWNNIAGKDLYFKTLFEKQSSAFDLNVCSSGDSVCESKTYNIDDLNNGETYTITPSNAPLFYSGDNNVYFMMHSDSDYNNKTPSMTAKLNYTFDKPTTTYTVEGMGSEKTVALTCIEGSLSGCDKTYYSINNSGYTEYTEPIKLNQPSVYTINYYSTDIYSQESVQTISVIVNPLGERVQNLIPSMMKFSFVLLIASISLALLSQTLIKNEYVSLFALMIGALAIVMIFLNILL